MIKGGFAGHLLGVDGYRPRFSPGMTAYSTFKTCPESRVMSYIRPKEDMPIVSGYGRVAATEPNVLVHQSTIVTGVTKPGGLIASTEQSI